ncbi:MAG: glutaredoxin [Alteromonadaceae bacterium]
MFIAMKALLIKLIRNGLGQVIIFIDFITRPKKMTRTEPQQERVNQQLQELSLYQFTGCPFCVKVRRQSHRLNLNLDLRDAKNNAQFRQELEEQGGRIKVPCLRKEQDGEVTWLYESNDIIAYLDAQFGQHDSLPLAAK